MGRRRALLLGLAAVAAIAGCGSDGEPAGGRPATATSSATTTATVPIPRPVDAAVPADLDGSARRAFVAGRDVVSASGCTACHRIGATGADAPGSALTAIGARRDAAAIRAALVDPPARMPGYGSLPRADLDALVAFLAALGGPGGPGGGESCPDESDCG